MTSPTPRTLIVSLAVGVVGAALVAGAPATAPGTNGPIAYSGYLDVQATTRAIFVVNADGTALRQLTDVTHGVQDINPDWSPDGARIAFARCANRCEVRVVPAGGGAPTRIGPTCQASPPPKCEDRDEPSWSPDGKTLAFDRGFGAVSHNTIKYSGVALSDPAGAHVRQLLTSRPYWGDIKSPAWSPDGSRLVVREDGGGWKASGPGKGHSALFVLSRSGNGLHRITPWSLNAGDPDWSPDGKMIVFRTEPGNNDSAPGGNLYAVRPDGTRLQQLTHFGGSTVVFSPSYSPDGSAIVFAKTGVSGQPDVFVMNADGTNVRPVTQTKLWESQADWGPTS